MDAIIEKAEKRRRAQAKASSAQMCTEFCSDYLIQRIEKV
jgi:hypothetical protein